MICCRGPRGLASFLQLRLIDWIDAARPLSSDRTRARNTERWATMASSDNRTQVCCSLHRISELNVTLGCLMNMVRRS